MRKVLTSLVIFIFAFFLFSATKVSAAFMTDKAGIVNVGKAEVINDDLFIGAQTVQIDGTVNGDVFIGAQTVKISGIINGSLHVGANTLDLGGTISGNVYAGAQNILVNSSTIGGSLLAGAATVNIDRDSSVGGSVLAGTGMLSIDSQIKRNVYAGTGSLTVGPDTVIGKNLYYASGKNQGQANISSSAKIMGTIHRSEMKTPQKDINIETAKKKIPAVINAFKLFATVISFTGALIAGFLYLKLFGKHFIKTADTVSRLFWKSFGTGFLITIAFIPGLIILCITVVGIPVAGLVFLIFLLYSYLAKIAVGSAFGNWISKKFNWKISTYGTFVLGLLAIYILKFIPVVGFLAGLAVFWTGLGALTLATFSKSK